ncbi:hypothetical protein I548_5110 [Mycobacterium intracellulare]|nr:hypothetical protein I548_5110 [Mycobacterium intracellulare]
MTPRLAERPASRGLGMERPASRLSSPPPAAARRTCGQPHVRARRHAPLWRKLPEKSRTF